MCVFVQLDDEHKESIQHSKKSTIRLKKEERTRKKAAKKALAGVSGTVGPTDAAVKSLDDTADEPSQSKSASKRDSKGGGTLSKMGKGIRSRFTRKKSR